MTRLSILGRALLVAVTITCVFSCSKDIENKRDSLSVQDAKEIFNNLQTRFQQIEKGSKPGKRKNKLMRRAMWDNAQTFDINSNESIVVTPVVFDQGLNWAGTGYRNMVVYKNRKTNQVTTRIVEVVYDKGVQQKDEIRLSNFSGSSIVYDENGGFLFGRHYSEGKIDGDVKVALDGEIMLNPASSGGRSVTLNGSYIRFQSDGCDDTATPTSTSDTDLEAWSFTHCNSVVMYTIRTNYSMPDYSDAAANWWRNYLNNGGGSNSSGTGGSGGGGGGGVPGDPNPIEVLIAESLLTRSQSIALNYIGDNWIAFNDDDKDVLMSKPWMVQYCQTASTGNGYNIVVKPSDQTQYPRFTALCKDLRGYVASNPNVMSALVHYSGFTQKEILTMLKFGQGPKIEIAEDSRPRIGYFSRLTPNVLNIKASYVRGLEQANLESTKQGTAFLLAVTVLHEFVHYGRYVNQISDKVNGFKYEFGHGFEVAAFGIIISPENANQYSYEFFPR